MIDRGKRVKWVKTTVSPDANREEQLSSGRPQSSQISEQMSIIENLISDNGKLCEELYNKLNPILINKEEVAMTEEKKDSSNLAPLSSELQIFSNHLCGINSGLRSMLSRIAL